MAFLGSDKLRELITHQEVITPFIDKRIKNGSYELSLGAEVYLTDSKEGKVDLLDSSNRQVDLNPGQFALLLTKERVKVPSDKIGFISIKAGEKLKGLINVSGFHVDPGFNDHLLFSVYNAGPSPIVLFHGEPYFLIWFAEMDQPLSPDQVYNKDNKHYGKLSNIPSSYIEVLKRGELTSPKALLEKIANTERQANEKIIRLDERLKKNNAWLNLVIGIIIAMALKLFWDWSAYDRGYKDGISRQTIKEQIRREVESALEKNSNDKK